MDVERSQTASAKRGSAAVSNGSDQSELAWAFIGLILWSAVVFGGIFGVGYVVGHSIFHWW
jgi:hypothetical protein